MRARQIASLLAFALVYSTVSSTYAESGALASSNEPQFVFDITGAALCVGTNPSCGRDPWWLQWNELQSTELVQFSLTERPLTVESRYQEALQVVWRWDEGKELLTDGSQFGVVILSGIFVREPTAIASYSTARRHIQINPRYARAATWMLAAVMSHELRHISDAHHRQFQAHAVDECLIRETRAYETESRFISWYTQAIVGEELPVQELRQQIPSEHRGLSDLLIRINAAPDAAELVRKDYGELCTRDP